MTFPEDFWWGTTMSSVGTEGVHRSADWSRFESRGKAEPSADGNNFATNYHEDFQLLASTGLRHVRLTVEWARLEPHPGVHDPDAFEHYQAMFDAAVEAGLSPWATMHNTSLPGWFAEDEGGFRDHRARNYFWPRHVDVVAELLDGRAAGWCPIDDPVGWAMRGFHLGSRPPAITENSEALIDAVHGALEAKLTAWKLLKGGDQPVMAVFGLPAIKALRDEAQEYATRWTDFLQTSWVQAIQEGEFAVPGKPSREHEDWVGAFDYIGINLDHPIAVEADNTLGPWPGTRVDATGYGPHTEASFEAFRAVAERLKGKPLVISAHGLSTDDDQWRTDLVRETAEQLVGVLDDGIDLRGYFHDTAIDGYSFDSGFEQPRGLFTRDRTPKPSFEGLVEALG